MKTKLKDYIDMIFADAADSEKVRELKEEMYANVCDKYDDLIAEGKSPAAAYNISIASIGDISELIDSVKEEQSGFDYGDSEDEGESDGEERYFTLSQQEEIKAYRKKSGIMSSVAVALYILCWVPLVLISSFAEALGGNSDLWGTVGVVVMMVMIAVATALMVLKSYIRPAFMKEKNLDIDGEKIKKVLKNKKRKNPMLKVISNVLWTVTVVVFLLLGFLQGLWHPGWIVFIIATAVDNVIEAIFEIAGKKYL